MANGPELTDELIAGRRSIGAMPADMAPWMAHTIRIIDTFSLWIGRIICWAVVPLALTMVFEIVARYAFTAPTVWAYDISRMLYGSMFVLGAAYALFRGVHIRADFIYRNWSVRTQGRIDAFLYVVFFFPTMILLLWVSSEWAWLSVTRFERSAETAWMPLLGPIKSTLPIGIAFLIIQGISELLKSFYAATKGRWPQQ